MEAVTITTTTVGVIKDSLHFIRGVSAAIKLQQTANASLAVISEDLNSVQKAIELVDAQEALKTKGVIGAIGIIKTRAQSLERYVEKVKKKANTGSSARQFGHQFMKGPGEWEELNSMIGQLNTAKSTLLLHIELAHVGLTTIPNVGGEAQYFLLDPALVARVNQFIERQLGQGIKLKVAEIFKDKKPDDHGMIHLTREEYEALPVLDARDDEPNGYATLRVSENQTYDQALIIGGEIGKEAWERLTYNLIVENNKAHGESIIIAGNQTDAVFDKLLAARSEALRMKAMSTGGQEALKGYKAWHELVPPPKTDDDKMDMS